MAKKIATSLLLSSFIVLAAAAHAETAKKTAPGNGPYGAPQATFTSHHLGTDHAEGISTIDMNGDGYLDLLSGAYWYENPGPQGGAWKQHQFRSVGTLGEFVSDCGEWAIDVNHDGAPDVVTTGWMTNGLFWYENPKKPDTMWERHFITDSFDTEGGWMADINGDGKPDVILAHYNHSGILWVDFSGPQPKVHHVGGKEQDGHGTGIADINGDGKADILTPTGWFENIDADHDQWKWHADWDLGETGFPIIGYDVNNDGKMDLIYGRGHSYGIYWMEQQGSGENRKWIQHTVDESFSQVHALKLVDIDGDGEPELIAGKRYRGHNGNDPGSYDPLVIYYYKIDRKTGQFTRYAISVNGTAAAGTQFVTEDLDKDGDIDIAVAGKTGVHFLENLRIDKVPKEQREREILLNKDWPFPNEGQVVQQENGPKQ
jgi:FG-GAP-like repeat/FG-GAP repeat